MESVVFLVLTTSAATTVSVLSSEQELDDTLVDTRGVASG